MTNGLSSFDVFFSYNHQDRLAVEAIARRLEDRGLTVFLDRWRLAAGRAWSSRVEDVLGNCGAVAVFIGTHGVGRWQQLEKELALERQSQDSSFPVIPVILPQAEPVFGFLTRNTWIDFSRGIAEAEFERLVMGIRGEAPGPGPREVSEICPYRGLRYFREEDASLFFGRDAFIERLVEVVHRKKLIAVAGDSGSGKSSVVRAGLVPRLRGQRGEPTWDVATMVPGDSPWHGLAAALVPFIESAESRTDLLLQAGKLANALASGEARLRDVVDTILQQQPDTDRLLLVIDQSEELFTLTRAEDQRKRFLDEIVSATTSSAMSVVLTLRADFLKDLLAILDERLQETIYVRPMTEEGLREAIELPAAKTGLSFQHGLVQRILDKVVERPGNLPLLEFVLAQLWERRENGVLTHDAYETIGEVEGAIATHADKVLRGLSGTEQAIARQIFLQLVRPVPVSAHELDDTADTRYARTRASFAELGAQKLPIVRKLADAHLLVTGRNEATGDETVDLVHEALLEQWDTLRNWIESDRTFLLWRRDFPTVKRVFGSDGLTGGSLREAERWLDERPDDLSTSERGYIESSITSRKNEERAREEEERARKNEELAEKKAFRVRAFLFVLIGFMLISVVSYVLNLADGDTPPTATTSGTEREGSGDELTASETESSASLQPQKDLPPLSDVRIPTSPVTIPVIVHVVHRTEEENISDEQVRSQIDALNRDFRARNDDLGNVPQPFKPLIGDAMIQFELVRITRTKTNRTSFEVDDSVKDPARGGIAGATPARFLNIWVCNLEGSLEYAMLPGGPVESDGVVISYKVFGYSTEFPSYSRGRLAVHAVGHYLNLFHLWSEQRRCTAYDDFVADTPRQEKSHSGKPTFPQISCNNGPNGDMFMNFMDYTDDDARLMFTKGQVQRMHQTLQGPRRSLIAPDVATER